MKTISRFLTAFMLSIMMTFSMSTYSQNPTYSCVLQNDTLLNFNTFQFEIYIYRTDSLELYLNNYQLSFNITNTPVVLNGGTLTGLYVAGSCQLPVQWEPTNMVILSNSSNKLPRINGPLPGTCGTLIPVTGLRIGTFQIINTMNYGQKPTLIWWNTVPALTRIYAIVQPVPCGTRVEITDMTSHIIYNTNNSFSGKVFNDINNNGVKDYNENGIPDIFIKTTKDNYIFNTDSNGNFTAYSQYSDDTITIISPNFSSSVPLFYPVIALDTGKNFALHFVLNINDVKVTVTKLTPARPGFDDITRVTYQNIGTNIMSGNVTLDFVNSISFISSNPTQSSINGNTISWNYSNLNPLEQRNIDVTFHIPPAMSLGTVLHFSGTIYPIVGDTIPVNNYNSIEQVVIGSYDPNEKEAIPDTGFTPQQLANGEKLVYTIHFQNTGTDTAFNVKIIDTLSQNVDATTFEMLSSSHPCTFNIREAGILEFNFNNILLPDSNVNLVGSNGFVKYAVKPKSALLLGDSITNMANIYFDFNAPVATNTTSSMILFPVGLWNEIPIESNIRVYPNPSNDLVTIDFPAYSSNNKTSLEILSIEGKLIKSLLVRESKTQVNISGLPSGVYIIKIMDTTGIAVRRMIKE